MQNSFLMLCMTTRAEDAPQNFPALETGPVGLFLKTISFASLFACLIRSSPH